MLLCSQPDTVRRFPLRETEFHHCTEHKVHGFISVAVSKEFVKRESVKEIQKEV